MYYHNKNVQLWLFSLGEALKLFDVVCFLFNAVPAAKAISWRQKVILPLKRLGTKPPKRYSHNII